jgi:hypothetical protein
MESCKPMSTPLKATSKLHKSITPKTSHEIQKMMDVPYKEFVGALCMQWLLLDQISLMQ